jgi:Tol biopolymer transport system component
MNRGALLLVLAAAACSADPAPPETCPDGYPAAATRPAGCTPGPGWLAYAFIKDGASTPALFISKADGNCAQRLTTDGAFYGPPTFFPGGKRLAYASTRGGLNQLYLRDLETGAETSIATTYAFSPPAAAETLTAASPAVSPDGLTVAFEGSLTAFPGWSELFTVPAAGGEVVRVTRDPVAATLPRWSHDGTLLYYLSYQTGAEELFSVQPDGAAVNRVTTGSALSSRFDVSGDGTALVYARFSSTGAGTKPTELVAQELVSGTVRVISSANEADPAVNAATTSVAVSRRNAASGYDLYLLDYATGAVKAQLTSCPGQAFGATFAR